MIFGIWNKDTGAHLSALLYVLSNAPSTWIFYHKSYICVDPPLNDFSCECKVHYFEWKIYGIQCICKAVHQYEFSNVQSNYSYVRRISSKKYIGKGVHQNELAHVLLSNTWIWTLSHKWCICEENPLNVLPWMRGIVYSTRGKAFFSGRSCKAG